MGRDGNIPLTVSKLQSASHMGDNYSLFCSKMSDFSDKQLGLKCLRLTFKYGALAPPPHLRLSSLPFISPPPHLGILHFLSEHTAARQA